MGLFNFSGKGKDDGAHKEPVFALGQEQGADDDAGNAIPQAINGVVNLTKRNAVVNLSKGSGTMRARVQWDSRTDYDIYAIVLLKDGTELIASAFGSDAQPSPTPEVLGGAVRHLGDVGRQDERAEESIEIRMAPEIAAVVPVVYSAQSNGTGSFHKYKVSMEIDNGAGGRVRIDANDANDDNRVYSAVVGALVPQGDGSVRVVNIEAYSARNSENRPSFKDGQLFMDTGSRNKYK